MMGVVGTVLAFVVVLVILVLVHELGHFVAAKLSGITVQEFGIGFPPRIASITWHGTRYSINAVPLGGFVKMLGEDGEGDAERLRGRGLSPAAVERAMAGAFNRKPIWLRVVVLVAGVAMNFVLAVVLFAGVAGQPRPNQVGPLTISVIQHPSPAEQNGLRVGDRIVAADGQSFGGRSIELTQYIASRAGQVVTLTVDRGGQRLEIKLEPESIAPNRYLYAQEMPLASLEPGDYSLYVTVRDAAGAMEVHRADFRVVP